MRKIEKSVRHGWIKACTLWQDDVLALFELVVEHTSRDLSIQSEGYQFDSLEELFRTKGPVIKDLKISGHGPYVSIDLSLSPSIWVDAQSGASSIFADFKDFFRERYSIMLQIEYFSMQLIALAGMVVGIYVLNHYAYEIWWAGILALVLLFMLGLGGLGFLFQFLPIAGPVRIRNVSKSKDEFSRHAKLSKRHERILLLMLGAAIGLAGQYLIAMLLK